MDTTWAGNGVWTIDETTLHVVATRPLAPKVSDDLRQPQQYLSSLEEVQLIVA
ncbi:MAG: hypothetical protein ACSLEN_10155 [Candidatus Malihini olakiniferum]